MAWTTRRDAPDYDARRRAVVWNERVPDRFPDVIVAPAAREEVAQAVAESAGPLAVRSGGHNWLGSSLRDGGTLLDLGALNRVEVDVERRTAVAEPGATHKLLADALVPHGLAFPIGHCPSVGLGGYLLAGGFGWNPRTWGPACWSMTAVDVVTTGGAELRIDVTSHGDLFWAARGAGLGFPAIVTRFHLDLYELPLILGRRVAYGVDALPGLMCWTAEALASLPPGIEISLIARQERVIVAATAFRDSRRAAEELLDEGLRDLPADRRMSDPEPEELALNELEGEGGWPEGFRHHADNCFVDAGLDRVGAVVVEAMRTTPSPHSRAVIAFAGRPSEGPDVALSRLGLHSVNLYATWKSSADDDANVAWVRRSMAGAAPWGKGHYIGETDLEADPGRKRACFTPGTWARLEQVAATYDPKRRLPGFL
jgi:FAD/FMN-containing dehydrogenase